MAQTKKIRQEKRAPVQRPPRSNFLVGLIVGLSVVAVVALAMPFIGPTDTTAAVRPPSRPAPTVPAAAPPPPPAFSESEVATTERVSVEEAKRLLDVGEAVIIDVRDAQSYATGHISGALQIPLGFVEGEIPWFSRDKKLITVCT